MNTTEIFEQIEEHVETYFFFDFPDLPSIEVMMEDFASEDNELGEVYKDDLTRFKQDFYDVFAEVYHDKKALCN